MITPTQIKRIRARVIMNTAVKRVYIDVPEEDMPIFKRFAKGMGWIIPENELIVDTDRERAIDDFFNNVHPNPDITEEEIIEEVRAVRYGK